MIGELRPYTDYKESGLPWLGPVPGHWSVTRIKTVLREADRRSENGAETLLSLTRVRGLIPHSDMTDKIHSAKTLAGYKRYRAGQVVMNRMQAWSGMFGAGELDGLVSPDYAVFDVLGGHSVKLVLQRLKTPDMVGQFALESKGIGSGFNRLYSDRFGPIPISLPPPDEQAAIVRFLDWANGRLERAIRAKRKVIALLNEQKQAIIHRAVTRGLDPDVPLKPSGIPWLGDIPQHWEVMPLKGVCAIQSGITLGKDYTGQTLREYPYLRVANVQAGHVNLSVVKTIRVTKTEADRCLLQRGDVLMTEGGDLDKLGRGCVWNAQVSPCLHQNHVFAVRPNQSRLEPRFLSALMGTSYARAYFQSTAKQTTNLAATNKTKLGMFKVLLPGMDEQHQIIATLDEELQPVNLATDRLNREIELLREYRTRLVADVVTGKLDVRAAAARLPDEVVPDAVDDDAEIAEELDSETEDVSA